MLNIALNYARSVTKDVSATLDCRVADCTKEEVVKMCPITCRWFDEIPTNGMTCDLIERNENIGDYNCSSNMDVTINCNINELQYHILLKLVLCLKNILTEFNLNLDQPAWCYEDVDCYNKTAMDFCTVTCLKRIGISHKRCASIACQQPRYFQCCLDNSTNLIGILRDPECPFHPPQPWECLKIMTCERDVKGKAYNILKLVNFLYVIE